MDPYITTCTIKGRNETLDIMKAITIILVIVGHCKIPSEYRDLIFSFHMPLFFVIGGYFFKPDSSSSLMKKSAKRLLIPYAVTGLFTAFFVMLGGNYHNAIECLLGVFWGNNGSPVAVYKMPMSGPVWFLLALFWCRVIFNYLYSFTNYWFFYSIILSVLASGFGYYFFNPPLGILIGMTALVFYALGLLFRIHKVKIGGGVFLVIVWLIALKFSKLEMAIYLYDIYPLCVVGSLGGITIVYIISKFFYEKLHLIRKPLILLGQNTLLILCYHHIMWRSMPFVNKLMPGLCLTSTILLNLCVPICLMILHLKIRTVFIENSTT